MTISHVNNYNVNINKVSKSGKNEKPIWNGKKPYKYLEDFGDAALAYDKKLKQYYSASYGKDLIKELKSELHGKFEDVIVNLFKSPDEYDADALYDAMHGMGTNEDTLIEIICSQNNIK